jgi:ceramide glucosyltransferase
MLLAPLLGMLAVTSFGLALWQVIAALRFPLHDWPRPGEYSPGVTVLKPLKGCEPHLKVCLSSWLEQTYGGKLQFLFGVASPQDPVCALVRELLVEHPGLDAELVICPQVLGTNAKVSTLIQLEGHAHHELVMVSDDDVRVAPDFLAGFVAAFQPPDVGLVSCFYRLANAPTWAMRWEAIAVNADFWSQVLQGQNLQPLDFALGAVMGLPRQVLENIGGFNALRDYLADDYRLGNLVAASGKKVMVSPLVVDCWSSPQSWGQVWRHQLRWARTIRFCKPAPYFLSIISNATLWPLLWLAVNPHKIVLAFVVILCLARTAQATLLARRLTRSWDSLPYAWLAWVKDLLQAMLWLGSWTGREVSWRGDRFQVLAGGKLLKN